MSEQFPPSWLERAFDHAAREEIFDGHAPVPYEPVLVLLGGQPAAGKTHAQNSVIFQHPEDDLVPITGDDLRRFHPKYNQLVMDAPLEMPGETAPVSGGLIKYALQNARTHRDGTSTITGEDSSRAETELTCRARSRSACNVATDVPGAGSLGRDRSAWAARRILVPASPRSRPDSSTTAATRSSVRAA